MTISIITTFMISPLSKGWLFFHYAAVVSLLTILLGMIPIWTKKPVNRWKYFHFSFMYWSVMVLYVAFAEFLTQVPYSPFFGVGMVGMVGIASGVIMIIGAIFFGLNISKWREVFSLEK